MDAKLLTVSEAAMALRVSRSTAYELIAAGELRTVSIGRARRVPVEALDEFIAKMVIEPPSARVRRLE